VISGLADATVVVEAPRRSGSLITADAALGQGRECFIVPGNVGAASAEGSLHYLRGYHGQARIVASVPLLLEDLGFAVDVKPAKAAGSLRMGDVERQVAGLIVAGQSTVDELVAVTELPVSTVLSVLTMLELRGLVVGAYGRYRPHGPLLPQIQPTSRRRGPP
jgi:DNA processing protein